VIALSLCTGQSVAQPSTQPTTARPRPPRPLTPHAQTLSHCWTRAANAFGWQKGPEPQPILSLYSFTSLL